MEDDFITIYADVFNQPLSLAETVGGLNHLGEKLTPCLPQ